MSQSASPLRRFFSFLATIFRWFRAIVLNLFFVLFVLLILSAIGEAPTLPIPPKAVLVLNPEGTLVEQRSVVGPEQFLARGNAEGEVLLSELVQTIRAAAEDERIKAMILQPEKLSSSAFSHLQDIGRALQAFKDAGKPLYAVAGNYSQGQYYLASFADEVMLNPLGSVDLEGFGTWQVYFQGALEKLGVQAHVFRVGTYKAAVEPFERNDMSPEAKSNFDELFGDLWDQYLRDVEAARELPRNAINTLLETYDQALARYQGDSAALALGEGLVDRVESLPASEAYIDERLSEEAEPLPRVGYLHYLRSQRPEPPLPGAGRVGLIVASGEIIDGEALPGTIGGDSLSYLIRQAREDEDLKALVLRINSPGGSAFASELIRGELEAFKETGRPLVVSMGGLAASGGYWISTPADEIWAASSTITGSIGIYGVIPTFEESFAKLGLSVDGTGTTSLSGAGIIGRPLTPMLERSIQLSIEHGYQRFLSLVAEARQMDVQAVDDIAQGQVWSGMRAREIGLVDEIGDLDQALSSAAQLAGLQTYTVVPVELPLSPFARLLLQLSSVPLVASLFDELPLVRKLISVNQPQVPQQLLELFGNLWTLPTYLNDPNAQYLHCELCELVRF
jgi:signal peptide peptidase SppA, 67K type